MRPVIYFDLETASLPNANDYVSAPDPPKMPSNYKTAETVAKWQEELPAKVEALRAASLSRAALDPHVSRIVVLGFLDATASLLPREVVHVCHTELDEEMALTDLWSLYSTYTRPQLVGWFVKFDIRTALIRSRYLGVKAPNIDLHPYNSSDYIELMDIYDCGALARGAEHVMSMSQDSVYKRLGGPELNDPITGADVPGCIAAGDYDRPEAHNLADLKRLRFIAEFLGVVRARQTVSA